jgi:hypothetical protein
MAVALSSDDGHSTLPDTLIGRDRAFSRKKLS